MCSGSQRLSGQPALGVDAAVSGGADAVMVLCVSVKFESLAMACAQPPRHPPSPAQPTPSHNRSHSQTLARGPNAASSVIIFSPQGNTKSLLERAHQYYTAHVVLYIKSQNALLDGQDVH